MPDRHLLGVSALIGLASLCTFSPAGAEPFIGQFELKDLESERGSFQFQSQNAWMRGQPARQVATGPDGIVLDENSVTRERYALELEMGFSDALKVRVGIEFEKERLGEPATLAQANDFDDLGLTELGVEIIAVLVSRSGDGAGFGVVAELEGSVDRDESSSLVLGPILEWQSGRWFFAAVPMLVYAFGGDADEGERIDDKWDFAYATQLAYALSPGWSLALEGYGTIERLGETGNPSEAALLFGDFDQHRVGPVLYHTRDLGNAEDARLSIGVGLLEGLNGNTPDHTVKLSIEMDF